MLPDPRGIRKSRSTTGGVANPADRGLSNIHRIPRSGGRVIHGEVPEHQRDNSSVGGDHQRLAGGRLLLISPYLKFNPRIKDLLEDQAQRWKTNIYIVYGKTELRSEETKWLADNFVRTSFREHLHAKCYMNDSHALVTSMNLYECSQVNNDEMGILVSAEDDPELYQEIKDDADLILRRSENVRLNVTRIDGINEPVQAAGETRPSGAEGKTALPEPGFCLRCASEIPFDPGRPYCKSDYRSWARFKKEEYEERHCHACGKEHGTSMAKPVCLSCHRKYRSLLRAKG